VEEGSVAERVGLRPGDTILEVNGTPFSTISHEEALKVSYSTFYILVPVNPIHIVVQFNLV
jgi:S1-C subfamily serine protease